MEEFSNILNVGKGDKEIVYSKAIKAGKRIYYLDVKKNLKEDLFIAITESKNFTHHLKFMTKQSLFFIIRQHLFHLL